MNKLGFIFCFALIFYSPQAQLFAAEIDMEEIDLNSTSTQTNTGIKGQLEQVATDNLTPAEWALIDQLYPFSIKRTTLMQLEEAKRQEQALASQNRIVHRELLDGPDAWHNTTPFTGFIKAGTLVVDTEDGAVYKTGKDLVVKARQKYPSSMYGYIQSPDDHRPSQKWILLSRNIDSLDATTDLYPAKPAIAPQKNQSHAELKKAADPQELLRIDNVLAYHLESVQPSYFKSLLSIDEGSAFQQRVGLKSHVDSNFGVGLGFVGNMIYGVWSPNQFTMTWAEFLVGPSIKLEFLASEYSHWQFVGSFQRSLYFSAGNDTDSFMFTSILWELELQRSQKTDWGVLVYGLNFNKQEMKFAQSTMIFSQLTSNMQRGSMTAIGLKIGFEFDFAL